MIFSLLRKITKINLDFPHPNVDCISNSFSKMLASRKISEIVELYDPVKFSSQKTFPLRAISKTFRQYPQEIHQTYTPEYKKMISDILSSLNSFRGQELADVLF